jgi:hypothetical protein
MGLLEDDLTAILADAKTKRIAVSVVHGTTTVNGILDDGTGVQTDESGLAMEIEPLSVLVKTGAITPAANDAITVDGVAYRVREIRPEPRDGKATRIILVKQT